MDTDPLLRPSPEVVYQELDGQIVLVHLGTNRIFALNPTGARLWELLVAGEARADIEKRLAVEFEVDSIEVAAEVEALLAKLIDEQLLT